MFESGGQSNTAGDPPYDLDRVRDGTLIRAIAGRNLSKADVFFYRRGEVAVVVKDYGKRPFLVRHTAGRLFIAREAAAYRAARGIPGLPEFFGRLGPTALALRLVEGAPLSSLDRAAVPAGFFDRVQTILDALHDRGIALADLHHRDVLVGPDGSATVVDLATAYVAGDGAGALRRAIFRSLAALDRVALARMRARYAEGNESQAVLDAAGRHGAALYRSGRRLKELWNRLRRRRSRGVSSGREEE